MKHCFALAVALLLLAPTASAQHARIADITARPAVQQAPTSPVVVRGDNFLALDRFYGYFNDALPTQGYGYADLDGLDYVKVADYPSTAANLPLGGTVGPDGRFWFVGRAGTQRGIYSFDLMDANLEYEEVIFPIDGLLSFGGDELPAGLAYDPVSGTMTMASLYCDLDDEGNYRQSLLYSIDVSTGLATYLRDLEDPAGSPEGPYYGVCLISYTWDGGDQIFGVDIVNDDLVQLDAATGQLVERYNDTFLFQVCYVQDSAYNYNDGYHYLLPHSCGSAGGAGPFYGGVYQCSPAQGCEFQGFISDNEPDGYEMLLAAFLWPGLVSTEAGATTTSVSLNVYPNPVADQARVALALERAENVQVAVYDLLGRRVATLHSGVTDTVDVTLAGRQLPSGVYFVTARGESFQTTQKIVVAH